MAEVNAQNVSVASKWLAFGVAIATISTALLAYFTYITYLETAELSKSQSRFDATFAAGSLVLVGDGAVFAEPTSLRVQPIFNALESGDLVGEFVPIAVDTGSSDRQAQTITFERIVERVCSYGGNRQRCTKPPIQLRVSIVVNGQPDTDDVSVR